MPSMHSCRYVAGRSVVLAIAKLLVLIFAQISYTMAFPLPMTTLFRPQEDGAKDADNPGLWLSLGVAAALVISGGAFAGLTIALMGQDEIHLQVIKTSGEGAERENAASVLRLLKKGKHWVLVTLLLSNVITNETLPVILDRSLGGGWPAVLGSTVLIVIFGEIVPQSICVRYGLPIGAWMAPCVLVLMYIMSPVAWPIAKLLDRILGRDHGTFYKKAGLKTLVTLHKNLGTAGEQLNSDEVTIITAVLDLKEKSVGGIMIPMEDVFTMSVDDVLDENTMDLILSHGYSRIPIHTPNNPENFVGMLLVKMLITYDPEDCKLVRDFALATLPETRPETSCLDIVNYFQEGKSHMILVSEYPGEDHGALGVVTLEDVIEELIGEEIIDESDVFIDVHKAIRRMAPAPKARVPKGRSDVASTAQAQGSLIGMSDDPFSSVSRSPQVDSSQYNPPQNLALGHGSPPTTFSLRKIRTLDSGNNADAPVVLKGPTPEMREHLKHLGPSNPASRPLQTRHHAVKIKPGSRSPIRSNQVPHRVDSIGQSPESPRRVSESASLLGIIAARVTPTASNAKDGSRGRQASYGTLENRAADSCLSADIIPGPASREINREGDHLAQVSSPVLQKQEGRSASPQTDGRNRPNSNDSTTLGSESSIQAPSYIHHGPVSSGSITEQIIDSNGIRKVILQTSRNSHASGDEDVKSKYRAGSRPGSASPPSDGKAGVTDSGVHSDSNLMSATRDPNALGGRKRRRRKKKRGDKPV